MQMAITWPYYVCHCLNIDDMLCVDIDICMHDILT